MRHLHILFSVPKDGQVTEKYLRRVLVSSLCSILLCMSCLVGSTWAWFQTTIVNEGNVITIGEMQVAVALRKGGESDSESITPSEAYTYKLDTVGTYSISLINTGSIPGYCEIKLTQNNGDSETFTSGTLYPSDGDTSVMDSATITITIDAEDNYNEVIPVKLKITPHWGTDPNYEIAAISEQIFASEEEDLEVIEPTADEESEDPVSTVETTVPEETESTVETTVPEETEPTVETTVPEETEATIETTVPGETQATIETTVPGETEATIETTVPGETQATVETTVPEETESTVETTVPEETEALEETKNEPTSQNGEDTQEPQTTESTPVESQPDQQTE